MRTLVPVLDPKVRRNRPLAPTGEVRTSIRSHCWMLTQHGIRDLPFLLFFQEDRTVFTTY